MKCRHCGAETTSTLIDLGTSPPSNAYLTQAQLQGPERWFPLRVLVCQNCWLVQTQDFAQAHELFDADYAYFSSFSSSWLAHAERYASQLSSDLGLGRDSHVVEVAANDGYLLQYFKDKGIPSTGIEPTSSTAAAARAKGISIVEDFFGARLARELVARGLQADLTAANNVLAHVPDINDFVAGFPILLKPDGVATFEFPHLLNLISENQFDTIYHEHFSYLSLIAVKRIFTANGLSIFHVEEHPTHGGSLRVFAQRTDTGRRPTRASVEEMLDREVGAGMATVEYYARLQQNAETIKYDFLAFLLKARREGHSVAGYGAAAKGNTLLNFAGVRSDLISYVVDRNPAKQGKYLPGSRIPIVDEDYLRLRKPRYVVVLPWNLRGEVMDQLAYIGSWGGRFVTAVPSLEVQV
jgi:SAM-dependent methyltransferase